MICDTMAWYFSRCRRSDEIEDNGRFWNNEKGAHS